MLAAIQPTVGPQVLGQHVHISEQIIPAIALLSQGLDSVNPVADGGQGFIAPSAISRAGSLTDIDALAAELVRLNLDVILAPETPQALAAMHATTRIPVVFMALADPVEVGLAASLAHPGGNLTGLTILAPEHSGKRLELLKEAVPDVSRVAVLR